MNTTSRRVLIVLALILAISLVVLISRRNGYANPKKDGTMSAEAFRELDKAEEIRQKLINQDEHEAESFHVKSHPTLSPQTPLSSTPTPPSFSSPLPPSPSSTPQASFCTMINAGLSGSATIYLNVTASHLSDPHLKTLSEFAIEDLIPFHAGEWLCNDDGSCYQNWLNMTFPPGGASWLPEYKTPCFIDRGYNDKFRCLPHVYMVGYAKSGTTTMWSYFQQHPDLIHGWKETQFLTQFSFKEDHKTMKKFSYVLYNWFDERSQKQKDSPKKLMYDSTATIIYDNWHWRIKQGYAGDPDIPTHTNFHYLRKIHPGALIVVMLRNPVTRALSFYNHGIDMSVKDNANLRFKYKKIPKAPEDIHQFFVDSIYYFNDCVERKSLRACCHLSGWLSQDWGDPKIFMTLRIGIYYVFLEEVYKNFKPGQVHLVKSEEFNEDTTQSLNDVFSFLGISTNHTQEVIRKQGGVVLMKMKKYFKPLPDTYRLLADFYRPFNKRLSVMLNDSRWLEWENELHGYFT